MAPEDSTAPTVRALSATDGDRVTAYVELGEVPKVAKMRFTGSAEEVAQAVADLLRHMDIAPTRPPGHRSDDVWARLPDNTEVLGAVIRRVLRRCV